MRLGMFLSSSFSSTRRLELAVEADDAGLDSVWLSEDQFHRGAMPLAGAIAAKTSRVELGFAVLTPYNRHPSLIAMNITALLELAPERVALGLGSGVAERTRQMGLEHRRPLAASAETVSMIRRLLAGERVEAEGVVHTASGLALDARPKTGAPPVLMASIGPQSLRQTRQIADGLILSLMASEGYVRWATAQLQDHGGSVHRQSGFRVVLPVPLAVADDLGMAASRLKPTIARYVVRWFGIPALRKLLTDWGGPSAGDLGRWRDRLEDGAPPEDTIPDEVAHAFGCATTPDGAAAMVQRWQDLGVTDLACYPPLGVPDRVFVQGLSVLRRAAPSFAPA